MHRAGEPPAAALAVVTVTCSPGGALSRHLDSLAAATVLRHHVVLADNGSVDGAPEAAARRDGVTLLRIGEDVGPGAAANRAIFALPAEVGWVVVASPQIVWTAGAIDELLAASVRWPRAGALGPMVVEPAGRLARAVEVPGERTVEWLPGCCLLLRRAAMDSVDGFDPRYYRHLADVDLGDRLARAGWLNITVPAARVLRVEAAPAVAPPGAGAPGGRAREAWLQAERDRGVYRYLAERHRGAQWGPWRLGLRAGLGARRALAARRRPTDAG